jgi:hypothetical protein
MAKGPAYRSQLSLDSAAFLVSLPKRQQCRVLDLADWIARHPFTPSDYRLPDDKGRTIEQLLRHGFLFSYRVDHADREVLIIDIIKT